MIVEERPPQAARFAAIVDAGLAAWSARWSLYLGVAIVCIAIEYAFARAFRFDPIAIAVVLSIVDSFAMALVTIDVAARACDERYALADLVRATIVRWPFVAIVAFVTLFIETMIYPWIFGTAEQTFYGLLILPALAVLGILGLPTVITALDTGLPLFALPGFAFFRSFLIASTWPNLGRLTVAGAMLAVPAMLQELLGHWLATPASSSAAIAFWSNVPLDALLLAPFQAFFTYLYLDFVVREKNAVRRRL